jgi:hypothetical protein
MSRRTNRKGTLGALLFFAMAGPPTRAPSLSPIHDFPAHWPGWPARTGADVHWTALGMPALDAKAAHQPSVAGVAARPGEKRRQLRVTGM